MKVAILGAGGMGRVHANQYAKMADVEVRFAEPDDDRAASFGARYPTLVRNPADDLLDWADVVDVCLPTDLHLDWTLRSLAAGKPVFVEKPMARTYEDGLAMMEAAERAGVALMPGQVVRFFPEFALGHRMVVDGAVGPPAAARLRRGGGTPRGAGGWFRDIARSGGVLLDLAIHDFDWLLWTLGPVDRITARAVAFSADPPAGGLDHGVATLRHTSGAISHVEASWMDPGGFRTEYEVAGPEGLIEWDSRRAPAVRTVTATGVALDNGLSPTDDPYYRELRGFLDSVAAGVPPPVCAREGLAALAVAMAALESACRGGEPIPL